MIADLKPYPEYRESELPWLGRVPDGWRVVRNGSLFGQRNETGYEQLPILEVSLRTGVRVRDFENSTRKQIMADLGKYKRAARGDVSYNMMRMWQGAVGIAPVDGLVSPAYVVARPFPGVEPRYFVTLFCTDDYKAEVDNCSRGIVKDRNRLYWDQFKQILSPCPSPSEQAAIVRFLEWANGRLERAIRAKRKVIALLNEQKQAIIHRAVTRGLSPSVPLKHSGIPWLDDIPQHWEVRRLGRTIRIQTGYPFASTGFVQGGSATRLLRGLNVTPSGLRWDSVVRWQRKLGDGLDEFELHVGDIVLGMDRPIIGSGVRAAAVQQLDTPSLLLQRVARLRPTHRLDAEFLLLLLRGRLFANYIAPIFTGISVPHLSPEQINGFRVPLPPLEEQRKIVSYVEGETNELRTVASRLEREIELLREYRTRLVADVVTGKLDVREAAARLPDEAAPDIVNDESDMSDEVESADEEVAAA